MCRKIESSTAKIINPTFEVKLSNAAVRVRLDAVEIIENEGEKTAVIHKYKTGKSPKKIDPENADVLMMIAAQENFPEANPSLQRIYLSDNSVQEVPISSRLIKNRLEKYEKAVEGINKRLFEPIPSENNCPHCPHFFICPSGE
jgi:CRISPR/Cas system-associated exonuclease Cas4 (RecB family)